MEKYPIDLTRLIHENLSIVMSFAYSRRPLADLIKNRSMGHWKYLEKAIFEIGEEKANRAIIELAILLRILDDEERIKDYDKEAGITCKCGRLMLENDKVEEMSFRDVSNKIIHAETFKWNFPANEDPKLICYGRENDRIKLPKWIKAEVDLVALAFYCGRLMS